METWKNVPGHEGRYQISIATKEGRLRSINSWHRPGPVVRKNHVGKNGYIMWQLWKNGKIIRHQAARWIAITYPELIQNEYFPGAVIDHINGDRTDNRPENLRWVTQKDNCNNPIAIARKRKVMLGNKLTQATKDKIRKTITGSQVPKRWKPVQQIKDGIVVAEYPNAAVAADSLNFKSFCNIYSCCSNARKKAAGYNWKYKEDI
jgi:hypothetical protein